MSEDELTLDKIRELIAKFGKTDIPIVLPRSFDITRYPEAFPGYYKDANGNEFFCGIPLFRSDYLVPESEIGYIVDNK